MKKSAIVVKGQSKTLYESDKPDTLIQEFRDDFIAPSGRKRKISGRAKSNNLISAFLFEYLESYHVATHYIKTEDNKKMLVRKLEMIPVRVVVRNIATEAFCKKYKFKEGSVLDYPVIEHYLKTGEKDEPFVNDFHLYALHHATPKEMRTIERMASKVNALMKSFFLRRNMQLVDFVLEFGRFKGKILVGDEISPETCTIRDDSKNLRYQRDLIARESRDAEKVYKTLLTQIVGEVKR